MRIAYFGPAPSEGGGVTYAAAVLLRALVAAGVEVDVYATECPPSLASLDGLSCVLEPVEYGVVSTLLGRTPLLKFAWGQARRALAQRRLADRLVEAHRRSRYDCVYQFSQPELLALRSRRSQLPAIVVHPEVHAAGELNWHRREDELAQQCEGRGRIVAVRAMLSARSWVQRRDLRSVAAVICPSAAFARDLARDYGLVPQRLAVVPNPIDLERFAPSARSRRPREIVFVSRMSVRKGVEMVVKLSHLLDDLADNVRVIVVGDSTMWSDYRPLLGALNPRVAEYRGHVPPEELPGLLAGASLVVQPSHYEPFALTVGEALASGTPVVVSDRVGAGEWLVGIEGDTFRAGDMPGFEAAVRVAISRMDASESEVRLQARQVAVRSFAPTEVAQSIIEVLEQAGQPRRKRRLLVVSHACVVDVNQSVYRELQSRGWDVRIVVPSTWRHEYAEGTVHPSALAGLEDALVPLPIFLPGRPQRHGYLANAAKIIADFRPDVMFLEQEPFSVAALQWGIAASRTQTPFGVQMDENLDRLFPLPARLIRRWILPRASFIAARSPTAAALGRRWGATGRVGVAPHAVPTWPTSNTNNGSGVFTVGFAGRLVPEKGIDDLLAALRKLPPPVKLLVAGAGPLKAKVEAAAGAGIDVEILAGLSHDQMGEVLARMDVLVLPSRTTATWAEQFGRVLVEAMSQRVPVVGSSSGEIPWVIETTGGGLTFAEGDAVELAAALQRLREDRVLRKELGERGAASVERIFVAGAAADSLEELIQGAMP